MLISSIFKLNSAIQAVPSACSKWPPVGNGALRSKTPILSSPRNPPSKAFLPERSLRLSHHVKLRSNFWKLRPSQATSARAGARFLQLVCKDGRPGVNRWVDVAEIPLVGGHLPVRMLIVF